MSLEDFWVEHIYIQINFFILMQSVQFFLYSFSLITGLSMLFFQQIVVLSV